MAGPGAAGANEAASLSESCRPRWPVSDEMTQTNLSERLRFAGTSGWRHFPSARLSPATFKAVIATGTATRGTRSKKNADRKGWSARDRRCSCSELLVLHRSGLPEG